MKMITLTRAFLGRLPTSSNTFLIHKNASKLIVCHKSTKDPPSSSSSSSSSESDEEKETKLSNNEAAKRLNVLLRQIIADSSTKKIKMAQPQNQREMGRQEKEKHPKPKPMEVQVTEAVKEVAENLGGDKKQTESELLTKLLNPVDAAGNLSDILKGMKIEREAKPPPSKAEQVKNVLKRFGTVEGDKAPIRRQRPKRSTVPITDESQIQTVNLFGGETLGIFTDPSELKESPQLPTWQKLHEKELKLAITHPPANYFQQMILWTEQGKLWQFPIDNEFGLEEEKKVYFSEHVFLEEHLEPWCPPKGPIRHFMELVCVGLSKNSYLSVQAKKEHIEWFRNYFEGKRALLEEVGAFPVEKSKPKSLDIE